MRAFITGAGSGFGLATARQLLNGGATVVATDVSTEGLADRIRSGGLTSGTLEVGLIDLRDPGLIVSTCRGAAAAGPVDVLVNNAGYAVFGDLEHTDPDAVSALLDANVLGTARVTRALLPALRAASGTVVQVSSVAGRMVFPESGFYAAAKYAIEAMSEALYVENCAFGVRVVVIEPGAFQTGFSARAQRASRDRPAQSAYADVAKVWDARKLEMLAAPQDPARVASAILTSLHHGPAFQRVVVGDDAQAMLAARAALGDDAWVRFMGARMGGSCDDTGVPAAEDIAASPEGPWPWPLLRTLDRAGMLTWWAASEAGRTALARVRAASSA